MTDRIEKLRDRLPAGADGAIIVSITNREYLSRFLSGDAGTLLVFRDAAYFIIDSRYIEIAGKKVVGAEVILQGDRAEQIRQLCVKHGARVVLGEQELTVGEYGELKRIFNGAGAELICDEVLSDAIRLLRSVKEPEEVEMIRQAQSITDRAFLEILGFIRPGISEKRIAAELEYYMRRMGADGMAFETIVASGENSSMPHAVPGDREVRQGDFVTMDYGALLEGYCSDMTRTVAVGKLTDEQYKVYDTVLQAHLAAEKAARAGMTGRELDKVARDLIDSAGYAGTFGHSLGHSLGLDIHEWPGASMRSDAVLTDGTIMTIEPGIYLEGRFGVRIENMVLIREGGCDNLTASERQLITI